MEIWKDIIGYEGRYQVSNLGNVKTLNYKKQNIEKVLCKYLEINGYYSVCLFKDDKKKTRLIHQLVAESFLNHTPCGYKLVVNHKNFIRTDNRLENLEVITHRENANKTHLKNSSKFVGVCFRKDANKWQSRILINGKRLSLGMYHNEYDAHLAYQKKLYTINN